MRVLGVWRDAAFIYCALLSQSKRTTAVLATQRIPVNSPRLREEFSLMGAHRIVAGLAASTLLFRKAMGVVRGRYFAQSVALHENTLTLLPEQEREAAYFWQKGSERLSFFFTQRTHLEAEVHGWAQLGLALDRLSACPWALCRYVMWRLPQFKDGWIFDSHAEGGALLALEAGHLIKVHSLSWGTVAEVQEELLRVATSLQGDRARRPLFFTGVFPAVFPSREWVLSVLVDHVTEDLSDLIPDEERAYAGAIGLALEEGSAADNAVQFLRGERTPVAQLRRLGWQKLLVCTVACLMQGALFWGGCRGLREQQERGIAITVPNSESMVFLEELPLQVRDLPKVSEVLSQLTSHPLWCEDPPFTLVSFRYQRPEAGEEVQVDLTFHAPSQEREEIFYRALQAQTGKNRCHKIRWESVMEGMHVTFAMR